MIMSLLDLNISDRALEKIIEELSKKLEVMPGLSTILDVYSMRAYRKRFVELFIEKPVEAYRIIEKVLADDKASINFVLTYLLRTFTRNDELINKIIEELSRGNDELLKKIVQGLAS